MLVNPETGRKIKEDGETHRKLLLRGKLSPILQTGLAPGVASVIYAHPDLYRVVLSHSLSDLRTVKNLLLVDKRTATIVSGWVDDNKKAELLILSVLRKSNQRTPPSRARVMYKLWHPFNARRMKALFDLSPLDFLVSFTGGKEEWDRYQGAVHGSDVAQKFMRMYRLSPDEILRRVYRQIRGMTELPVGLRQLPLILWPNRCTIRYSFGATSRNDRNRRTVQATVPAFAPGDVMRLPSLVQDDVEFVVSCSFAPQMPGDLSFLEHSV